jgi:hypothetical protein
MKKSGIGRATSDQTGCSPRMIPLTPITTENPYTPTSKRTCTTLHRATSALAVDSHRVMQMLKQICFGIVTLLFCAWGNTAQEKYFPTGSFYDSPRIDQFKSE